MKETINHFFKRVNFSYLNIKIALKSINKNFGYRRLLSYFFIVLFFTAFLLQTFTETVPSEAVVPEEEVVVEQLITERLNKYVEECEVSTQIQLCKGLYIGKGEVWTGTETFCEGASIKTTFKEEVTLKFLIIENPEERLPTGVFSRPRDIKITLQGTNPNATTYYSKELEDTDEAQWIEVDNTTIKSITIEILSGYPAEGDGVYCAIDEIEFYGSSEHEPNRGSILSTTLSNQNDGAGLNPEINIGICNNSIGLYETESYQITYKFHNKPKKFTIVFTDSTGDLSIDLLSEIESQEEDMYAGNVTLDVYAEGLPGEDALKTRIVAEDILGGKSYITCSNDLYTINMSSEGDYKRKHIRTPLVRDEHYQTSVSFTGKVWEQEWESIEDCATDKYIQYDVEDWNNDLEYYNLTEPITGEEICSLNVEDSRYRYAKKFIQSFTYPVLNEEDTIFTDHYSFYELHPIGKCAAIINDEIFNYVETTITGFQRSLTWRDHWGMTFTGSYRLVGVNTEEPYSQEKLIEISNDPHHRSKSPWVSVGYSDNFPESGIGIGHRNSPPEKSFYLSEYGMVDRQPIRYISFIFQIYTFTGGNHGMYEYLTFNYDLDECKRIYLKDIMSDEIITKSVEQYLDTDALWLDLLARRVGDIWAISKGTPGGVDLKGISYDAMRAVSINEDGLTISFQPYDLQGWAWGWPEVSISWINLWDIFTWGNWEERGYVIYEDTVLSEDLFEDFLKKDNLIKYNWVADELLIGATHSYSRTRPFLRSQREYTISDRPVHKQTEGAVYGLDGDFTQKDEALTKRFVEVVNHIIGKDFLSYSDNLEEVTVPIKISESSCLSGNMWDYILYGDDCGLAGWFSSEENTVWVDSNLFGRERDSTLIHELGHSIGLFHTSCKEIGLMSIELVEDVLSFSDYEVALIKFLYSPLVLKDENDQKYKDIEKGMTFDDLLLFVSQGWTHSSFDMKSDSPSESASLIRLQSEGLKDSPEDGICVYPDLGSSS